MSVHEQNMSLCIVLDFHCTVAILVFGAYSFIVVDAHQILSIMRMFSAHMRQNLMWHVLPKSTGAFCNIKFIDTSTLPCSEKRQYNIC